MAGQLRVLKTMDRLKHFLPLFAVVVACWGAECRTPLGVPCYTIRFAHSQWQFAREGRPVFSHYTWTSVKALRADGSSVEAIGGGQQRDWFTSEARAAGPVSLYLAPEDTLIQVDHERKSITRRQPRIWNERHYRASTPGDRTCVSSIRQWGTTFFLRGQDTVAGVPVIRWTGANPGGGYTEVYLAPSVDCRPLKTYTVYRKLGIIPTFINSTEATSVELGAPKPELFALPTGYHETKE